jgi:hypothetical protein
MDLRFYDGEKVRLTTVDGETVEGYAEYAYAEDHAPEMGEEEGLVLDIKNEKYPIEFPRHDIKSIEIIK